MLINKILLYSAKKNKTNPLALYSVLNPDTSSDSPSAKSKGVRFVSARAEINHKIAIGKRIRIINILSLNNFFNLKEELITTKLNSRIANLTS